MGGAAAEKLEARIKAFDSAVDARRINPYWTPGEEVIKKARAVEAASDEITTIAEEEAKAAAAALDAVLKVRTKDAAAELANKAREHTRKAAEQRIGTEKAKQSIRNATTTLHRDDVILPHLEIVLQKVRGNVATSKSDYRRAFRAAVKARAIADTTPD